MGGKRYDEQGSAYAIRINREAIHRKDRGRRGQGRGKGRKGGKRKALQKVNVYKYPPIGRMEILSHDGLCL